MRVEVAEFVGLQGTGHTPLPPEEIGRLLSVCDDSPTGLRNRAIVLTLLDTGARCSEVVALRLEDLDLAAGRLRILAGVAFADLLELLLDRATCGVES